MIVPDLGYLQLRFRGFCRGTSPPSCHSAALSPMEAAKFDGREPYQKKSVRPKMQLETFREWVGWSQGRECSGDAVLLPSFGQCRSQIKEGLRLTCAWNAGKSREVSQVYSLFVVTREDDDLESHSKLGILHSCWQQEKCMVFFLAVSMHFLFWHTCCSSWPGWPEWQSWKTLMLTTLHCRDWSVASSDERK